MKVWIVWNERENSNKSTSIDKIFSTEKKALEYIAKVKEDNNSDKYIEEFEVDQTKEVDYHIIITITITKRMNGEISITTDSPLLARLINPFPLDI